MPLPDHTATTRFLNRLTAAAPTQWPAIIKRFTKRHRLAPSDLDTIIRRLDERAERAAFLGGFIEARYGTTGETPKTITPSIQRGQRRQLKVSKDLGYLTPERRLYLRGNTPKE